MWSSRPTHKKTKQARNPDMAAIKQLDQLITEAIHYEDQVEQLADIIGNVDHIHDEYEPADKIENFFIEMLVMAEIRAEQIVDIIHPDDFLDHDNYWHAVIDVRLYLQHTDVNDITIEHLEDVIAKGFKLCGL